MSALLRIGLFPVFALCLAVHQPAYGQAGQAPADSARYGNTPPELAPYGRFQEPYRVFFNQELEYPGYGRQLPEPTGVTSVKIGFIGPIVPLEAEAAEGTRPRSLRATETRTRWDGYSGSHLAPIGIKMMQGAQLAVEQANARGGYRGELPFELVIRNDNGQWRSAGEAVIKMAYRDSVWAILGSVDGDNSHILIRVALKAELPVINSADTDPTFVETNIPWVFRHIADDRQMCYLLAHFAFEQLGIQKVATLRAINRYGRVNTDEFRDAATRLGYPYQYEFAYQEGDTTFTAQLEQIKATGADAVFTYGNALESALIVKEMRQMGMDQWVLGSDRMVTPEFFEIAGPDPGRVVAGYPYDPTRDDPAFLQFQVDFRERFGEEPETYAAHAYDSMNILLLAIEKAGLNRALIRDELAAMKTYDGAVGRQQLDHVNAHRGPVALAIVRKGGWTFYSEEEVEAGKATAESITP